MVQGRHVAMQAAPGCCSKSDRGARGRHEAKENDEFPSET